jgi:hypothetical protein
LLEAYGCKRTSENPVQAQFAESLFPFLG